MNSENQTKQVGIHPSAKMLSGFAPDTPDETVREYWEHEFPSEVVEKPCGILMWCPYGPLVEEFPLHPEAEAYAIQHGKYVRWDATPHGKRPDGSQYPGRWVECGPDDQGAMPDLDYAVGKIEEPRSCSIFGHDCPAFHVAEPFADPEAVADNCLCDECRAKLEELAAEKE